MKVKELYAALEARIPRELSCSWDNDGLLCCPDPEAEVHRVLVVLDITGEVVERAIAEGFDAVLSHHPLIFRPLRAVRADDPVAGKVVRLLRAGISAMSFHTRLDAVSGGVNDTLAAALGLGEVEPFGENGETIGRIGTLAAPMCLSDFAAAVKAATKAPVVLAGDAGRPVSRVAILGGSGSGDVKAALAAGADTYLSGELSHHDLTDAKDTGINLLAAGHFHTENPVCETLCRMLGELDPAIDAVQADSNPVLVL